MVPFDPAHWGLGAAAVAFAVGAAVVWFAGVRLTRSAGMLAERLGLGDAYVGFVLLAVATSLPEISTSIVASLGGNADLATANLLGGVSAQVAVLAVADLFRRKALTAGRMTAVVLLQGVLLVALLTVAAAGMALGEVQAGPVGLWSSLLFAGYLASLALSRGSRARKAWRATGALPADGAGPALPASVRGLWVAFALAAAAILAGGWTLARSAEALAHQTGLGTHFVGALFLAVATSLPEVTTTVTAVRLGRVAMAVANVLGSNLLEVGLLFVVDLLAPGKPILDGGGTFGVAACLLGILLTCTLLVGLVERRDRTWLRLGLDSWALLAIYGGGVALLYTLR